MTSIEQEFWDALLESARDTLSHWPLWRREPSWFSAMRSSLPTVYLHALGL